VCGFGHGAFAEYIAVPQNGLAPKPLQACRTTPPALVLATVARRTIRRAGRGCWSAWMKASACS